MPVRPMTQARFFALGLTGLAAVWGCKPATTTTPDTTVSPTGQVADSTEPGHVVPTQVLLPVPAEKTISYKLWFQVGSQHDPVGREGLAWLTAQLIADGGTQAKPYADIVEALYPMAAGYGARVDREMTTISGRVHVDHRADYETLLSQAITQPAFDQADFERLKAEAKNYLEKSLRYAQDEELGKAALYDFVFEGSRYAHPPEGTVAGLDAITLDDVKAFYAKHYTRGALVVGLGGGYEESSLEALEAARALLPEGEAVPAPAIGIPAIEGRELRIIHKPGADASISFGFPIDVHRGEKDYYALWIANSWLGEHRNSSSHLFQVIREKRGLNYGDYSYIEVFPEGGWRQMPPTNVARRHQLFEVWIRTLPNEHAHFALRAAMRELETLVEQGMTQADFELTKAFLSKYVLHFADNTSDRLGYALDDAFYGIDGNHLQRFREMMDTLTLDDVNGAIKRHLQPANLKIAISTGEPEALRAAIVEDKPSPMTYATPKSDAVMQEDPVIASYPLRVDAAKASTVPVEEFLAK